MRWIFCSIKNVRFSGGIENLGTKGERPVGSRLNSDGAMNEIKCCEQRDITASFHLLRFFRRLSFSQYLCPFLVSVERVVS